MLHTRHIRYYLVKVLRFLWAKTDLWSNCGRIINDRKFTDEAITFFYNFSGRFQIDALGKIQKSIELSLVNDTYRI